MGDKRTKQRITSKIDELPEDLRMKVDVMLADTSNTYEYISQFLKGEGYDISKSSVGRYATRTNNAMQRLLEAQAQTDRLIQVVKENPEADYTEAAILLTMNGLLNKVATAEEEFNEMPLDKAGRLIASLSRTSKTTTTKETYTSERWGKEGGTTIHQISFTVDISKIKDLPLLYKLIDELKDAQNRTDSPTPATT